MVPDAQAGTDLIRLARPDVGRGGARRDRRGARDRPADDGRRRSTSSRRCSPRACRHARTRSPSRRGRRRCTSPCSRSGSARATRCSSPRTRSRRRRTSSRSRARRPVLVDVDPVTMNIDPADAARRVTPRTKAVLAVHLFGRPARLEELPELPLIEDAAGALGARRRGRPCGGARRASPASRFHPRKIVTTGEGGAVTTNDDALAERVRSLRHHGWSPSDGYDDMPAPGVQLPPQRRPLRARHPAAAPARRAARRARARRARLRRAARRPATSSLPDADEGDRHGWQAYVVQVDRRDEVHGRAPRAGDPVPDRHVRAAPARRLPRPGPVSRAPTRVFERALALPLHTRLTEGELDRVAEALDKLVSHH